jgi:hypothetical protein
MNSPSFGMGMDLQGNLYSFGGTATGSGPSERWLTRKSVDGVQWTTIDDFQFSNYSVAKDFATSPSGDIFVVGSGFSGGTQHWLVRKSSDHGITWTIVDDFVYATGQPSYASKVKVDNSGNIYVVGYGQITSSSDFHWIVRKSVNSGSTWSTVDDFQMISGEQSYPFAIEVDGSGNVYIAGEGFDGASPHWIVRKSIDLGSTWSTIDNYQYESRLAYANSLAINQLGVIYVAGVGYDGSAYHWLTRQSTDGGTSWTNIDDVYGARANSVGIDFDGHPVVAGETDLNNGSPSHWLVRKYIQ